MPFLMARTPARSGVVASRRLRAAAGPVVREGRPAVTWLNRVGLARLGRVLQPYLTPRVVVMGSRAGRRELGVAVRRKEGGNFVVVVGVVVESEDGSCRQQWAGSRGAMMDSSLVVSISRLGCGLTDWWAGYDIGSSRIIVTPRWNWCRRHESGVCFAGWKF